MEKPLRLFSTLTKSVITSILLLSSSQLFAQTEIGIAPGESEHYSRQHNVSILPITDVFIHVEGTDSALVGARVDSFRVIQGALKVKTDFTLSVSSAAPVGQLSVKVVFVYSADGALTQNVNEDFLINTNVQPSIVADFTADPVNGSVPLVVNFNNESFGEILGYLWDFGDSTTSAEQNPQHTYNQSGLYTVSLTVFNFSVQNKKTKDNYINAGGVSSLKESTHHQPGKIYLGQNYPNPFNPQTTITYYLPQAEHVEIALYDITGKRVSTLVNGLQGAGEHSLTLNAGKLTSGIYFYNMKTKDFSDTKKLIVNK